MKRQIPGHGRAAAFVIFVVAALAAGEADFAHAACVDTLVARVVADPKLDSPFFKTNKSSWPWNIVEHEDGTLEDTFGGKADRRKVKKIEHTADCISSHQGRHVMNFCDAEKKGGQIVLLVSGGMPAYAGILKIVIEGNQFTCFFDAAYPGGMVPLEWRVLKKELRVKSDFSRKGARLYAWISMEFEEIGREESNPYRRLHKIEGYLKPVIQ